MAEIEGYIKHERNDHEWEKEIEDSSEEDAYHRKAYATMIQHCSCGAVKTWTRKFNPYGTKFYTDVNFHFISPHF